MHSVALLTASYAKDIERFSLLSESIDTWFTGYTRHYVLVNDEDCRCSRRLHPTSASSFRPRIICRNGSGRCRRLASVPQQTARLAVAAVVAGAWLAHPADPQDRRRAQRARAARLHPGLDNLFFREFDVGQYAGAEKTPLFVTPKESTLTTRCMGCGCAQSISCSASRTGPSPPMTMSATRWSGTRTPRAR